jgi:hypothetical protein
MRDLLAPEARFMRWRLRSLLCAVLDAVAAQAGEGLFIVAAADSVASWPADRVLLTDPQLSRLAKMLLPLAWLWVIACAVMTSGLRQRADGGGPARSRPRLSRLGRAAMVASVVVCAW